MGISENDLKKEFNEFLDENIDPFKVGKYEYAPSDTLKLVDPVAYHEEYLNWLDFKISEGSIIVKNGVYYEGHDDVSD